MIVNTLQNVDWHQYKDLEAIYKEYKDQISWSLVSA
jgi:glutathione peroxidase-family protein